MLYIVYSFIYTFLNRITITDFVICSITFLLMLSWYNLMDSSFAKGTVYVPLVMTGKRSPLFSVLNVCLQAAEQRSKFVRYSEWFSAPPLNLLLVKHLMICPKHTFWRSSVVTAARQPRISETILFLSFYNFWSLQVFFLELSFPEMTDFWLKAGMGQRIDCKPFSKSYLVLWHSLMLR